jgi:hypothetical protein
LGYLTSAVENVAYVFVLVGVNAAAIIIATALFPIFYTAGIAFGIAGLKGRANRLAGPGTPEIAYPRFLPLGGKSQVCVQRFFSMLNYLNIEWLGSTLIEARPRIWCFTRRQQKAQAQAGSWAYSGSSNPNHSWRLP